MCLRAWPMTVQQTTSHDQNLLCLDSEVCSCSTHNTGSSCGLFGCANTPTEVDATISEHTQGDHMEPTNQGKLLWCNGYLLLKRISLDRCSNHHWCKHLWFSQGHTDKLFCPRSVMSWHLTLCCKCIYVVMQSLDERKTWPQVKIYSIAQFTAFNILHSTSQTTSRSRNGRRKRRWPYYQEKSIEGKEKVKGSSVRTAQVVWSLVYIR